MGVWIEIDGKRTKSFGIPVTPFMGVWIEIYCKEIFALKDYKSLPSWECGLK